MIVDFGDGFTNPAGVTQVRKNHVIHPYGFFPESASEQ